MSWMSMLKNGRSILPFIIYSVKETKGALVFFSLFIPINDWNEKHQLGKVSLLLEFSEEQME
jgi:hypothetical protein